MRTVLFSPLPAAVRTQAAVLLTPSVVRHISDLQLTATLSKRHPLRLQDLGLTLELQPSIVYEILHESALLDIKEEDFDGGFFVERVSPELADAFARLLRSLANKNDLKVLAPSIVREIHYRLMNSRYGTKIRQLGEVGSKTQRIGKVVEHLQKDYAAPLKVTDLAQMASMSPSPFHLHFRQVTNMSPLQYQMQIRLQEARRLLTVDAVDAASVAFRVGYESPSQFSREYRRLFGQPPMRDLERLRLTGVAQDFEPRSPHH